MLLDKLIEIRKDKELSKIGISIKRQLKKHKKWLTFEQFIDGKWVFMGTNDLLEPGYECRLAYKETKKEPKLF